MTHESTLQRPAFVITPRSVLIAALPALIAAISTVALADSTAPAANPQAAIAPMHHVDTAAMPGNDELPAEQHPWPAASVNRTVAGVPAPPMTATEWPSQPVQRRVRGVPRPPA